MCVSVWVWVCVEGGGRSESRHHGGLLHEEWFDEVLRFEPKKLVTIMASV